MACSPHSRLLIPVTLWPGHELVLRKKDNKCDSEIPIIIIIIGSSSHLSSFYLKR